VKHWPVEHIRSEWRTAHEEMAAIYTGVPGRGAQTVEGVRKHRSTRPRVEGVEGILYQWRDKQEGTFRKKRPGPVVDTPAIAALKKEVDQLKIALADKTLEAGFFKGALQSIEDRRRKTVSSGDSVSTDTSRE
jgi:hypothetical protein